MDRSLIDRYEADARTPLRGIAGLSPQQLLAFPVPGTWSIQQIVLHLLDSDLIASDRMKRIIAEDRPALIAYDETAFSRNLFYDRMDATLAAELFAGNRRLTASLLRLLPDAAFTRVGRHNERGDLTLAGLVQVYVDHVPHHMKHLIRKRELLGAPMPA